LISVVVLTRNRPGKLSRCVQSLLAQAVDSDFEIIIVDDGSDADAARVGHRLAEGNEPVRYVHQPHRGIPGARNLGLRSARGAFIAFVADDYVLQADYLATGHRYLVNHPEAAAVRFRIMPLKDHFGGRVSHCYYDASILYRRELEALPAREKRGRLHPFLHALTPASMTAGVTHSLEASGAALFRSGVFDVVGGFDERLQRGEDTEFTKRFRQAGFEVHIVPTQLVRHDYDRWPADTLRKCLLTGYWRAALTPTTSDSAYSGIGLVARKMVGISHAFWIAKLSGGTRRYLAYLPWLLAFETATFMGYMTYLARERLSGARAESGSARAAVAEAGRGDED